jgi:putative hemolysin
MPAQPGFRFQTTWASTTEEVREAQRLRFRVFAEELGARLVVPPGAPPGHDMDRLDDFCAHLLVRALTPGDECPQVVGTYRVLTPAAAERAGGCYSDTEFDMGRLAPLRPRMAELGRSCVDPAWRSGSVILALWAALGEFLVEHRLDLAFGCASIDLKDGGYRAGALWHRLSARHLAPPERQVEPKHPLPVARLRGDADVAMPPLIKGYLRCGAELLGPPAWDSDFHTADLPMLMTLAGLPQRHRRRFLARPHQGESA